jgi:hypothetical protein
MPDSIGKKLWLLSAGHIPLHSTGEEPEFTSHDKLSVLNTSDEDAELIVTIYYESDEPVHDYTITVKAKRVRKIKLNDLIDPLPIPLDKHYGILIRANVNVVIQFSRMDTSSSLSHGFCVTPFYRITV